VVEDEKEKKTKKTGNNIMNLGNKLGNKLGMKNLEVQERHIYVNLFM